MQSTVGYRGSCQAATTNWSEQRPEGVSCLTWLIIFISIFFLPSWPSALSTVIKNPCLLFTCHIILLFIWNNVRCSPLETFYCWCMSWQIAPVRCDGAHIKHVSELEKKESSLWWVQRSVKGSTGLWIREDLELSQFKIFGILNLSIIFLSMVSGVGWQDTQTWGQHASLLKIGQKNFPSSESKRGAALQPATLTKCPGSEDTVVRRQTDRK